MYDTYPRVGEHELRHDGRDDSVSQNPNASRAIRDQLPEGLSGDFTNLLLSTPPVRELKL